MLNNLIIRGLLKGSVFGFKCDGSFKSFKWRSYEEAFVKEYHNDKNEMRKKAK